MSINKRNFDNGCFPSNWLEIDLRDAKAPQEEQATRVEIEETRHKDLVTLLAELEEIKNAFEKIEEKKTRLQNLMMFYRGELATE